MRFLTFLLYSFLFIPSAFPQFEGVGVAYFAAQHKSFPCEVALRVLQNIREPSLATLWRTFGTSNACLTRFLNDCEAQGKQCTLQIHLMNGSCRRFNRCGAGELKRSAGVQQLNDLFSSRDPETISAFRRRVESVVDFITPYQSTVNLILSTGLEDNYNEEAFSVIVETIRAEWSGSVSRNPESKIETSYPDIIIERHGMQLDAADNSSAGCIWSNDGNDVVLSHARGEVSNSVSAPELLTKIDRNRERGCGVFAWWSNQGWNGNRFDYPRRRRIRIFAEDVFAMNKILRKYNARKID